jgi:formylglycine-generating enzyme required for sulfatase activity
LIFDHSSNLKESIMKTIFRFTTMLLLAFLTVAVKANGLAITNVSLQSQNISADTWDVRFNLSWDNSWRDGINHDAAWIFIKYRINNGAWAHAVLRQTGFNTGTGTGTELRISPDSIGAMANRSSDAYGTYSVTSMRLQWHYGATGVLDTDLPQVRVLGIEMVQIPEGPFAIGDGDGSSESFFALGVADNNYYVVNTELSPPLRADGSFSTGNNIVRIDGNGGVDNDGNGVIDNASYPVGYNSFYMMKYEITQEQYADFLSMIISSQSAVRFMSQFGNNRNRISLSGGSYFTDRPDRACNYISWQDGLAYTDWAGLRPFTETEYEKSCRGPIMPNLNEMAWGSTTLSPGHSSNTTSQYPTISGTENGTEVLSSTSNNVNLFTNWGINKLSGHTDGSGTAPAAPLRVGIFADASGNSRINSGASYYGVMDLTGNLSEQMVNITSTSGRSFSGAHGNGVIGTNGNHDVSGWVSGNGCGHKLAWMSNNDNPAIYVGTWFAVSVRRNIETELSRDTHSGFRCARTQWW